MHDPHGHKLNFTVIKGGHDKKQENVNLRNKNDIKTT